MQKELFTYQNLGFEFKTISEFNLNEDKDLIVITKYNRKLLEFGHAHFEKFADFKSQNKAELEDKLYGITKSEIKSKFFERMHIE